MDLSAMLGGGNPPDKVQNPAIEYDAIAASPIVSGEAKLSIGENALTVTTPMDAAEIPFAEINALAFVDYAVTIQADSGKYIFSRMGNWAQPFYEALCEAYNKAVLRSLFVEGKRILTAAGEYRYAENGTAASGSAPIHIYENSLVILPPDLGARRIPLCFVTALEKGDYTLTLKLDAGESYALSKLGYDTAPFADAVERQLRKMREKTLAAVKELDPALTTAQASQLAKLLPEGAAAPIGCLAAAAPSFVSALEGKIGETRASAYYEGFKELTDPTSIYVGFRKNESLAEGGSGALGQLLSGGSNPFAALGGLMGNSAPAADGEEAEASPPAPYLFWLIVPSPNGRYAAVEFSEADSATFVYRTGGAFDRFAKQLNRALEAIAFKREVIRLSDGELRRPENTDYYMANRRTAALQFVRAGYAGRAIHSNPQAWKKKLTELWSGQAEAPGVPLEPRSKPKFCGECGGQIISGVRFCGSCGAKI